MTDVLTYSASAHDAAVEESALLTKLEEAGLISPVTTGKLAFS